jgi:hypothetical protein
LCAHVTGIIGECEVGKEYIDETINAMFEGIICFKPDDNGCYRPVSLGGCYSTPTYTADDVVIWFDKIPTREMLDVIKERALTFIERYKALYKWGNHTIEILGIDLIDIEHSLKTETTKIF